jgi:hypothetical protein
VEIYETHGVRNVPTYMPDNKLDVKTEMLQMKKNWASLERETSNVNTNVKNLMRA